MLQYFMKFYSNDEFCAFSKTNFQQNQVAHKNYDGQYPYFVDISDVLRSTSVDS